MSACTGCGFWESDCEACTCPSYEMWYACPIESERPENKKAMEDYIKQLKERDVAPDTNVGNTIPEEHRKHIMKRFMRRT